MYPKSIGPMRTYVAQAELMDKNKLLRGVAIIDEFMTMVHQH